MNIYYSYFDAYLTLKYKNMFKKIITLSVLVALYFNGNAQEKRRSSKDIISKGFFVNVGLAFPSQTFTVTKVKQDKTTPTGVVTTDSTGAKYDAQSLGILPSIEVGNQWYFWKNEKMGVGLRVSWFQFGFSTYTLNDSKLIYGSDLNVTNVDLRFIKLAPQYTYALTEDMALDFSFEVAPTVFIGAVAKDDNIYATSSVGLLFAPGLKFRYKVFAAGFDYGFGAPSTAAISTFGNSSDSKLVSTATGTAATSYPRIYLGFKF